MEIYEVVFCSVWFVWCVIIWLLFFGYVFYFLLEEYIIVDFGIWDKLIFSCWNEWMVMKEDVGWGLFWR